VKILFATYPMAFHTPGGGEVQLLAYQKHLPPLGVEVALMDLWNPRFLEHDVVHFFSCVGGSIHLCNFVKRLNLPLVISSSLWITEDTRDAYPVDEIRSQLLLADRIITNSEMESEMLADVLDIPRDRFASVYNGVDDIFATRPSESLFRERFGIAGKFVLNVGNIEPRKNQSVLAQAVSNLPDHKLVLIGHVRDADYLNATVAAGKPEQVIYLGPLPHDSELLRSAYQACSSFCLPSTLETPGLAALEAAVQGCPLVITEVGSTREYFGDAATYVCPRDPSSILQGLRQTMSATAPTGRNTLDTQAFMHQYSWTQVTKKLKEIYASV